MDKQQKELHWFEKLPAEKRKSKHSKVRGSSKERKPKKQTSMSKKKDVSLEKYTEEADRWIDEVAVYLKTADRRDWAWSALRGVLHAIRDRITPEEVFQLSAQLPMLLRGLFLEGYNLNNKPEKFHLTDLIDRIEISMGPGVTLKPESAFKAVLLVLQDHVSEGEINDIYATLPKDIRQLWDKSLEKYTV
ncbi:DUF2267 domain-containing protein [Aliifodinibius sp. S!AR15-10]|uniref:DUF2267 domain-containing protein n=1 Tax=Aliifodinibius sp. S!AR15-10 TaxID=2950437 RepID=UPI0028671767|nr:DUF2267 domain-containing protein [Aliifodinibius sp. S!AR15-10]MDR8393237.1 DUF2267 domain-containing protein [Aliifodinibius sp. S!AR15-10]